MRYVVSSLLVLLIASCSSCERNDIAVGGRGGKATLRVSPMHDGKYVTADVTIYIEYNSDDLPENKSFDDSAKCVLENGKPVATFSGLKKGKYYLMARGYDPLHASDIKGGAKYTITEEDVIDYVLTTAH